MNKLIINKGEYIFSNKENREIKIKLTVFYQKRTFKWRWLKSPKMNENVDLFVQYIEDFATRMIESKSDRNFYTE